LNEFYVQDFLTELPARRIFVRQVELRRSIHRRRKTKHMAKKLTLPLAAVAVLLALVLPATAAAEDVLLPVGTLIKVSGKNLTVQSATLGQIKCNKWEWQGKLKENGGTLLIESMPGSGSECINGTKTVVVNSTKIEPTKAVGESGTLGYQLNVTIGGSLTCAWTGTGVWTFTKGTDEAAPGESKLTASPAACGTSKVTGAFTDQYFNEETKMWESVKWL
jgi:hypothetical protein